MSWQGWVIVACFIALGIQTGVEVWRDHKSGSFDKRYQNWRKGK